MQARELPDARAKRSVNEKKHQLLGWMEQVFCVNCGADGGMISKDWAAYVFHLCDTCVEAFGPPPATPVTSDDERLMRG